MTMKAKLKIHLLANDVLIAESDDEVLWRKVLAALQGGESAKLDGEIGEGEEPDSLSGGGVGGFAKQLGVTLNELKGACGPSKEAPYLHLDAHSWEELKKNTPQRGRGSVAGASLAATLLCLWFNHGGIEGRPTMADAKAVLDTIGLSEANQSRSIRNCEWLQVRSGGIQINPARQSRAIVFAKAYCTAKPPDSND